MMRKTATQSKTKRLFQRWFKKPTSARAFGPFPESTALVVHGLHKSASMFLYKFFADLCEQLGVPVFSIHEDNSAPHPDAEKRSFVFCPVRDFLFEQHRYPHLQRKLHLAQVRDPRDILVSDYFSMGWLHSDENWNAEAKARRQAIQGSSIDQFVIDETMTGKLPLLERMAPLLEVMDDEAVSVVKYETMVCDFPSWLTQVLDFLELNTAELHRRLCFQYRDEFQRTPQTSTHKRNISPGDHRDKLQPETIAILNQRFESVLERLGYSF